MRKRIFRLVSASERRVTMRRPRTRLLRGLRSLAPDLFGSMVTTTLTASSFRAIGRGYHTPMPIGSPRDSTAGGISPDSGAAAASRKIADLWVMDLSEMDFPATDSIATIISAGATPIMEIVPTGIRTEATNPIADHADS